MKVTLIPNLPLRRAPLFWIGLLPVVILLWAWADSRHYMSIWSYGRDPRHAGVYHITGSKLQMNLISTKSALGRESEAISPHQALVRTGAWGHWERWKLPPTKRPAWFPMPFIDSSSQIIPDTQLLRESTILLIPFWLVLLLYVPLWLRLSYWQARRITARQRLAEWRLRKAVKEETEG